MPTVVTGLLLSKKFVVAVLTAIAAVAAYKGWNVDPTVIIAFASPLFVYIGAQGWSEVGEKKARVEGETAVQLKTMDQYHATALQQAAHANAVELQKMAQAHDLLRPSSFLGTVGLPIGQNQPTDASSDQKSTVATQTDNKEANQQ